MIRFVIEHENNQIVLVKNENINIDIEGSDKKVYRIGFRELESFEGKSTVISLYQSSSLYTSWKCGEICDRDTYPNKILIHISSENGWFADIIYDNIKDEFYRINNVRDIEILNKVQDPILIAGSIGGGTSYITKIIKYCGVYFGTDSGIIENRKHHQSVTFDTMKDILGVYKHKYLDWGNINEVKIIQNQLKDKFNFYHILFKNQLEYRFSNFWGDAPLNSVWAFKQPSIVTALPLWKSIFPKSRLILIKRGKKKASKNMWDEQGEWFRNDVNNSMIDHYYNPDISNFAKDDVFYCDFNKTVTERKSMNRMLEWIGFSELLKTDFAFSKLLQATGYEGKIQEVNDGS